MIFIEDQESMQWCNLKLDRINVETFVDAVKNEYWFEFFIGTDLQKNIEL
jgi:hypothetical protein